MEGYASKEEEDGPPSLVNRGRRDGASFVNFFMQSSSYIMGHRGKTFVVVIPGEAFEDPDVTEDVLDNLALLHALRVRVVAVVGCFPQIQQRLAARGVASRFEGGYRVTCPGALVAAMESAGVVREVTQARLSKGPSVAMVRRHQRDMQGFHFRPVLQVRVSVADWHPRPAAQGHGWPLPPCRGPRGRAPLLAGAPRAGGPGRGGPAATPSDGNPPSPPPPGAFAGLDGELRGGQAARDRGRGGLWADGGGALRVRGPHL